MEGRVTEGAVIEYNNGLSELVIQVESHDERGTRFVHLVSRDRDEDKIIYYVGENAGRFLMPHLEKEQIIGKGNKDYRRYDKMLRGAGL